MKMEDCFGYECHYCNITFEDHGDLLLHKLEYHPLEYAEEKRVQNFQRIQNNGVHQIRNIGGRMTAMFHGSDFLMDVEATTDDRPPMGPASPTQTTQFRIQKIVNEVIAAAGAPARNSVVQPNRIFVAAADQYLTAVGTEPQQNTSGHHLSGASAGETNEVELMDPFVQQLLNDQQNGTWNCPLCDQKYRAAASLQLHIQLTHLEQGNSDSSIRPYFKPTNDGLGKNDCGRGGKKRQCQTCGIWMQNEHALQLHLFSHYKDVNYECGFCEAKFSSVVDLQDHARIHITTSEYKCVNCGECFGSHLARMKHLYSNTCLRQPPEAKEKQSPNPPAPTGLPPKKRSILAPSNANPTSSNTPILVQNLSNHVQSRKDEGSVVNIAVLENPVRPKTPKRPFIPIMKPPERVLIPCPHCKKKLTNERLFQIHMRLHNGNKPYKCPLCDATFATVQGLSTHAGSQKCGAVKNPLHHSNFTSTAPPPAPQPQQSSGGNHDNAGLDLSQRDTAVAPTENNIQPPETMTFYLADNILDDQGRYSEGFEPPDAMETDSAAAEEDAINALKGNAQIPCPLCKKQFRSMYFFKIHLSSHNGVKPYKCLQCGEKFSTSQGLSNHRRSHAQHGPYICACCGQLFPSEQLRNIHEIHGCSSYFSGAAYRSKSSGRADGARIRADEDNGGLGNSDELMAETDGAIKSARRTNAFDLHQGSPPSIDYRHEDASAQGNEAVTEDIGEVIHAAERGSPIPDTDGVERPEEDDAPATNGNTYTAATTIPCYRHSASPQGDAHSVKGIGLDEDVADNTLEPDPYEYADSDDGNDNVGSAKDTEMMTPDVLLVDESTLTPLAKNPPALWVVTDRLEQIEVCPITREQAEHAASGLAKEILKTTRKRLEKEVLENSSRVESDVDFGEEEEGADDPFQYVRSDHSYSLEPSNDSHGKKLWKKARRGMETIITAGKDELPSHQCSKCRSCFTESEFNGHECKTPPGSRRNSCENSLPCSTAAASQNAVENTGAIRRACSMEFTHCTSPSSSVWGRKILKRHRRPPLVKSHSWPESRHVSHRGFGKLKCPLCETHFRKAHTVKHHLISYHRVSMSSQRSLGFATSDGAAMARLRSLADNMKQCIGQIVKEAESQQSSIRATFRRVGRSNSFEVDIDQ